MTLTFHASCVGEGRVAATLATSTTANPIARSIGRNERTLHRDLGRAWQARTEFHSKERLTTQARMKCSLPALDLDRHPRKNKDVRVDVCAVRNWHVRDDTKCAINVSMRCEWQQCSPTRSGSMINEKNVMHIW